MKDIDFDELDRAVNSLMGSAPKEESDDQPKQKTLDINPTLKPGEKPAYDKLEEVAKKIGSETLDTGSGRLNVEDLTSISQQSSQRPAAPVSQPVAGAATRLSPAQAPQSTAIPQSKHRIAVPQRPSRGGRFMDVVHPSSDMKSAAAQPAKPSNTPAVENPPVAEEPPVTVPVPEPKPAPQAEPAAEPVPSGPVANPPLTPFLPDAKVEKRPLGGATAPTDNADVPSSDSDTNPAEEKALEIAEIESINSERVKDTKDGDSQRPLDPSDFHAGPSEETQKLESIESAEIKEASPVDSESMRAVESGDTGGVVAGGDTQETNGHIYDVGNYHQPIGHPAKQKSGWGTIVIILIIILVCAVAGGVFFFLSMNQ